MFEKAMLVTDLWNAEFPIEKCVRGLSAMGFEKFYLVECLEQKELPGMNLDVMAASVKDELQRQRRFLLKAGFNVDVDVLIEKACMGINRRAVEKNCSLMVIGGYRHTRTYEFLLGSRSCEFIDHHVLPLLMLHILPHGMQKSFIKKDGYDFLQHVLFPTDFSENAAHAACYLKQIAGKGVRHITLMHVQNKTVLSPHLEHRIEEFNKTDRGRLVTLKDEISSVSGVHVDIEIAYGHPVTEITGFAEARDVSMILMGSQGRGFLRDALVGSISRNVARMAETPVMLIPARQKDSAPACFPPQR